MKEDNEIIGEGGKLTQEAVGLGYGGDGQKDEDLIGSDAWHKAVEKQHDETISDYNRDVETAEMERENEMYERFMAIEEEKTKSAEEALGIKTAEDKATDKLAKEAGIELEDTSSSGGKKKDTEPESDDGAPQQRTVQTRDQAVNLLKRHAQVQDAMLEGLGDKDVISWAQRVQPLWQQSQQNFRRVQELEAAPNLRAEGKDAPSDKGQDKEHSEEASVSEPSADQPSLVGVNLDVLERELPEELGTAGGELVKALKVIQEENQKLRGELQQIAGTNEEREVKESLARLAQESYPQLEDNEQLQQAVHQQARVQVQTGQYSSYDQLMRDAALLVLGPPQGGAGAKAGERGKSKRDRGLPSVPRTRSADNAATSSKDPNEAAFVAFQKIEAEKTRRAAMGLPY